VAFLIIDENTTPDVRASAQSLFGLVVFGIGIIVGSIVAGWVGEQATVSAGPPPVFDYKIMFSYPMWGSVACLVILLLAYKNKKGLT
jgi:MFS family permease